MTGPRVDFQALDHTADVGILVRAPSAALLFERAAAAMFSIVAELEAVAPCSWEAVQVEAPDREALLVAWLSELLSRHAVHGRLYSRFEVSELSGTSLSGRVAGEAMDPSRHALETEIKAVTYHGLLVSEDREGWSARVIFDV